MRKIIGIGILLGCFLSMEVAAQMALTILQPMLVEDLNQNQKPLLNSSDYQQMRGGIKNSFLRFESEKKGRVAFLGGSITYNPGWRDSISNYLQKRFPNTEFEFIAAGIPSMGTTPAAFRLVRDVLSEGSIDLIFEEAAVNDASNGRTKEEQIRGMEGIVRHLRYENPEVDIVMMHFVDPDKMDVYRKGGIPKVIQNHEKVAAHYKIPSINLAREVTDRIDAEEFTWEDDFKDLHPSPFGQGIYARSMIAFLEKAWPDNVVEEGKIIAHHLPEPIDTDCYDRGELMMSKNATTKKGWDYIRNWEPSDNKPTRENYTRVPIMENIGGKGVLKFNFKGSAVGIAVAAGPDAGLIEYSIDGGKWYEKDLFTSWSKSLHLPWYYTLAVGLESKKHTLKIRSTTKKNDQSIGHACRIRYFYVDN